MQVRRLISSWLLLTVLLTPVLGLAACASAESIAKTPCAHCAIKGEAMEGSTQHTPAPEPLPAAPCCRRGTPALAMNDPAAQIVAPVQFAILDAVAQNPMLQHVPVTRVERTVTPPLTTSPLSLLCTLLI